MLLEWQIIDVNNSSCLGLMHQLIALKAVQMSCHEEREEKERGGNIEKHCSSLLFSSLVCSEERRDLRRRGPLFPALLSRHCDVYQCSASSSIYRQSIGRKSFRVGVASPLLRERKSEKVTVGRRDSQSLKEKRQLSTSCVLQLERAFNGEH